MAGIKNLLKGFAVLIGLLLIVVAGVFIYVARGLDRDYPTPLEGRSAAELENGRYQGEDKGGRWSNKVEEIIENRKIADINIIDDMLFTSAEFSQGIIENVLENQQTDTEVVTGLTIT